MGLLYRRPLALLCFLFLLAMLLFAFAGAAVTLISGILFAVAAAVLAIFLIRRRLRQLLLLFCLLTLLFASLFSFLTLHRYAWQAEPFGDLRVTLEGTVAEWIEGKDKGAFLLDCERVNGEKMRGLIYVSYNGDPLRAGDTVYLEASLSTPAEWEGAERYYRLADGIFAYAHLPSELQVTGTDPSLFRRISAVFAAWRCTLADRLTEGAGEKGGALLSAMLLGRREYLAPSVSLDFRYAGLSHVLCISGFHLAFVSGLVLFFLRLFGLSRRIRYAATAAAAVFYVALTGLPVSAVRACLMLLILSLSKILFRRADGLTSLAVAAAMILLFSPHAIYDYGFLLSVTATFGILVYTEWQSAHRTREKGSLWRRAIQAVTNTLCVTLCALGATLPLSALFFGSVSLITPLSNLLLVPLFEGYMFLALPALLLGASPLTPLIGGLGEGILAILTAMARMRGVLLPLSHTPIRILLFLLFATALILLCMRRPPLRLTRSLLLSQGALITILLIFLQGISFGQNGVSYTISNKNEVLFLYSEGKFFCCDCTDGGYEASYLFEEEAATMHRTECEGYLLTHYRGGHLESTESILSRLRVRCLYLPTPKSEADEAAFHALTKLAEKHAVPWIRYDENANLLLGNLEFMPLHNPTENGHAELAFAVRGEEDVLLYLGGAYQTKKGADFFANAVKNSTHLIFGRHASLPSDPIPYTSFSPALKRIILVNPSRLPEALQAELTARKIPYYTQIGRGYLPLS